MNRRKLEKNDTFVIKCLMCFGPDLETQERLAKAIIPVVPDGHCLLCRGSGNLELERDRALIGKSIQTLGRNGPHGYPLIRVAL